MSYLQVFSRLIVFLVVGSCAAAADVTTMREQWDTNVALMTGVDFPQQISCLTEEVFSCNLDTENCEDDVSDYGDDLPAQSWHFDFSSMRVTMDKGRSDGESRGDLRYLGGTTYLMALDEHPQLTGLIASFSHREQQVYLNWYTPTFLGIAIQGHSGPCMTRSP